jgi:hypothetical protein
MSLLLGLSFGLSSCLPWHEAPPEVPAIEILDLDITMAIEPPFWQYSPYYGQENYFPEGETLLVTPIVRTLKENQLTYRLRITRLKDGWTIYSNTSQEIIWDDLHNRFIITMPLIGQGCPHRGDIEVWDYEFWLEAMDTEGNKDIYTEIVHIVPMHYYWPGE